MEENLLSQAQLHGQEALKYQTAGSYDSAIKHHLLAVELLQKLQDKLPKSNSLIESFNYFIQYHQHQIDLDKAILEFAVHYKAHQVSTDSRVTMMESKPERPKKTDLPKVPTSSLCVRRNLDPRFEQLDSLLPPSSQYVTPPYTIRPRNESEITEEHSTVIDHLRAVIEQQARQIVELTKKSFQDDETIRILKQRLLQYEPISSHMSQYIPSTIPELPPLEPPPNCDYF